MPVDHGIATDHPAAMDLASRLTRCPIPLDPDQAKEAAAALPGLCAPLRDLVMGAAGCSPYLAMLIGRESAWLAQAFADP